MKRILITGGAGFAGHHVVEHFIKNTDWEIVVFDRLSYASNGWNRLRDISVYEDPRLKTFTVDFVQPISEGVVQEIGEMDFILHMGAETHVDNSIVDAEPFVMSNVLGTLRMLELARLQDHLRQFIYFSTDEVFGPAQRGQNYKEWDRYDSTNPYAATKAGGEELCLAYANTHKVPVLITHTMNLYGERQHPEKFIPLVIRKVLADEPVTIHSDSTLQIPGSRFYIHCRNMASAVQFLLERGDPDGYDGGYFQRDKVNIVGEQEVSNLELAEMIAEMLHKGLQFIPVDFHSSRPVHDLRYALDGGKLEEMGWKTPVTCEQSLERTVRWMVEHKEWLYWDQKVLERGGSNGQG